jgi:hypothetical protein
MAQNLIFVPVYRQSEEILIYFGVMVAVPILCDSLIRTQSQTQDCRYDHVCSLMVCRAYPLVLQVFGYDRRTIRVGHEE